ncbi:MAG: PAS domain S-box protein [Candidatus Jettenia sp.]|uniref:histidine kinase n=1 Tax=Candidatus Jettenia caeni TaxID=247490 RepID=I3IH21_9BACT|nr:PAS domain S-box protein [Candidatus Jettenia sp. AMX1]MBC6929070.1 PAS domain S-box protein [Candidatus Jettenia sp.]WKZ16346.1 MAG: PAS domain S-box protein [Candidatus Jettenia caeni]KAA0249313.1 MAG: PAS domain S-box protein [Candidatus Jettenia sp. AMX1]MCE7880326.1 PAS domain S-box protein [Candidatus Jettenia sp. AMX1]MCQ3928439.1 PAS domain S-box protein [Candidatus Jettenia sp.]
MKKCARPLSVKVLFGILIILLPVFITFLLIYKQNKAYLKEHILDDITILAGFYECHMSQFLEAAKLPIQNVTSDGFIKTQCMKDIVLKHVVDTFPVNVCLTVNKEIRRFYKNYRGREVIGASRYIPSMKWVLLVGIHKDEVLVPIKKVLIGVLIPAVIVIVLVICLCIRFMKKAVKPFRTISNIAKYIAVGAPDITVPAQIQAGDGTAKVTRIIGTIQDITECERMEEEIKLLQTIIISTSEADDLHSVLDIVLCKVCKYTDWDYGEAWLPSSDDGYLKCIQVWHNNSEGLEEFRKKSQKFTFLPGVGLPGRVWSLGAPEWRKDATVDGDFPRASIAKECGLKAAIGIPVIANDKVIAVLNFFVREQHDKDERLIGLISSVATQLGVIIQRKQIEEALYNSEERLQAILNNATALIYVKDMQGRYTFINKLCEKVLQIKQEELKDKADYDMWSKEIADALRINDRKVIEASVSLEFEEVVPHDDGLHTYISVKFPLYDSHGIMHSICGISTDITGRKRMEKLLHEKEEKYRLLVENIPDVMWTADQTGTTLFITPNIEKVYGYTPEEIYKAGNSLWFERIHPEDVERVREEYSLLFKLNKIFDVKYRIRRKDESWIWIHDRAVITYTKDGNRYANGLFSDITEHKQMEEQLQKLSCAIEQSSNVIIITDTCGNIQYVNPKFTELTGYSTEEVIGKNPCILKSGKTSREEYKRLWNTISSGGKWRGEFLNKKKNGDLYWEIANISPVKNKEGIITHFIEIAEDITNIKKAEESESKLKEQLYHVQKLESIGTLAGGIAHDFNNILAIIMGYGNLLQNELEKDNSLMIYIQKILTSTERAANLTKGLLTFSRKQKNNPKPVNLNEVIKRVESLLVRLIGEDIQLKTIFIDKNCIVMADSNQIEQVLMNLVTNARDAMPDGGSLTIITEVVELDSEFIKIHGYGMVGKYVLVSISDTGIGMDNETKKRIFEPFFTTKEVGKGTGLGLAIVYGIVKQHQGYINVDSEPGKGSIFKMYIPVIESVVDEIESEMLVTKGGKETILLAEDEKEVRILIKIVLQKAGYKIIEAVDGDDMIRKFIDNKNKIHCLIVDVIMPIKDGKAAYDVIRQIAPDIKALFISGYSEEVINKKDILKEGLHFIPKPVLPNELLRRVREVLEV